MPSEISSVPPYLSYVIPWPLIHLELWVMKKNLRWKLLAGPLYNEIFCNKQSASLHRPSTIFSTNTGTIANVAYPCTRLVYSSVKNWVITWALLLQSPCSSRFHCEMVWCIHPQHLTAHDLGARYFRNMWFTLRQTLHNFFSANFIPSIISLSLNLPHWSKSVFQYTINMATQECLSCI